MGSFWAAASISFLAIGFLAAIVCERFINRHLPLVVSIVPTFLSLCTALALYVASVSGPIQITLFDWNSIPDLSIALAYYIDAWGALLAALALFLGLCAQVLFATQKSWDRTEHNWAQICIFGALAILLNLVFSASLVMLYASWSIIGIVVYVFLTTSRDQRQNETDTQQPATERMFVMKQLIGYAFLGGILFIARTGDISPIPVNLHSVSLGLAPSILIALGIGAYLGLYPFNPWPRYTINDEHSGGRPGYSTRCSEAATIPLSIFPAIAAVYVLGRLYSAMAAGVTLPFSTILLLMGLATIIIASVRAWRATDLDMLLANITSVELGFVAIAFALAPLHNGENNTSGLVDINSFSAGVLIFMNCILAVEAVALTATKLLNNPRLLSRPDGMLSLPRPLRSLLLVAPWLSLVGLPFTLGFIAKSMLFAASFDLTHIVLWPVSAIADILIVVVSLRFIDRMLFAEQSLSQPLGPAAAESASSSAVSDESSASDEPVAKESSLSRALSRIPWRPVANIAIRISPLWIISPWIVSFVLGLMPNQALRWIIHPSATAILGGDSASFSPPEAVVTGSPLFAVTLALTLGVAFIAFYLYPVPLARMAIVGHKLGEGEDVEGSELAPFGLRFKVLETVVDIIAAIVMYLSALDWILSRLSSVMRRVSSWVLNLDDTVHENYYFPSLAVLGIILLFVFLG